MCSAVPGVGVAKNSSRLATCHRNYQSNSILGLGLHTSLVALAYHSCFPQKMWSIGRPGPFVPLWSPCVLAHRQLWQKCLRVRYACVAPHRKTSCNMSLAGKVFRLGLITRWQFVHSRWSLCFNIVLREECSSEDIFGVGIGEKFKRTDSVTAARRVIPDLVLIT